MIHEYTPTTDRVRNAWVYASTGGESDRTYQEAAGLFDRWLAAFEAEIRERIAQEIKAEARRRWNAGWTDWTERESGLDDGLTEAARIAEGRYAPPHGRGAS